MSWAGGVVVFGAAATSKNLQRMEQQSLVGFKRGMKEWIRRVAVESTVEVPRITGNLARSMRWGVTNGHPSSGFISYNAPYAGTVHENPRPPSSTGKWKYLEDPWKRNQPNMVPMISAEVMKSLRGK